MLTCHSARPNATLPRHNAACSAAEGRPIVIEETTARAFESLLHFLYSDILEVEDEFLVDVLRYRARLRGTG